MDATAEPLVCLLWEAGRLEPRADRIRGLTSTLADPCGAVDRAGEHGIEALLWRALDRAGCRAWLGPRETEVARQAATSRHEGLLLVPLALETALRPLAAIGLDPLLFKGPCLAGRYPEPGLRPMGDLDLILPADQHARAIRALQRAGWTVVRPAGSGHYESVLAHPDVPRLYLELHRQLDVWYERSTGLQAQTLWRRRMPSQQLGIPVAALPPEEELVALAAHAGKPHHTFRRLIWTTDLVVVAEWAAAAGRPVDWDRVRSLSRAWNCQTVTAVALGQARRLGLAVPEACTATNASRIRRQMLLPVEGPQWPVLADDESLRTGLRFALVDRWPRRISMFVGAPAPAPLRRWPAEWARLGRAGCRRAWDAWQASASGRPLRSLARMTWRERLTVAYLAGWLGLAELSVRVASLPSVSRRFGCPLATGPSPVRTGDPVARLSPEERHRLHLLGRLTDRWPLEPGPCLRRALVQGHLLRRHCPALCIGVGRTGSGVVGHAWIEIDGHSLDPHPGFLPLAS